MTVLKFWQESDEHLRVVALAQEPAVVIGESDHDGFDLAMGDTLAQLTSSVSMPLTSARSSAMRPYRARSQSLQGCQLSALQPGRFGL